MSQLSAWIREHTLCQIRALSVSGSFLTIFCLPCVFFWTQNHLLYADVVNLIVNYLARVIVESAHLVATKAALYQVRVRRVRVDSLLA